MPKPRPTETDLGAAVAGAIPQIDRLREAAQGAPLFLVGGALRDLLLGCTPVDFDVAVEGDAAMVAKNLGGEVLEHEPFLTATTRLGDAQLNLNSTRTETYTAPGALPEVRPASLAEDLPRRDFTVHAMAWPLQGEGHLIDPLAGLTDLRDGLLRVLHDRSFVDDPTRALRAARYAARLGFELEPGTAKLIGEADLATVSADRRAAELMRLAFEPTAAEGLSLAARWRLFRPRPGAEELLPAADELLSRPPWDEAPRPRTLLRAARGPEGREAELAAARPERPSEAVELAEGCRLEELVLGRAMGAEWLEDYMSTWRDVELEIDGAELLRAGVPEGPAVGRGLREALHRKLDGEISGREAELRVALAAAGDPGTPDGSAGDGGDGVA